MGKGEVQGTPSTQVIIAALNEEEGIGLTISELNKTLKNPRILVVDGRSTDRTVEIAKNMGASVVCQDGLGKVDALAQAIAQSDLTVDYVVITDADYTYPAENVPEMLQILEQMPQVGMVCGNRFSKQTEGNAFQGRFTFGNKLLAFAHSFLNGIDLQDPLRL